MTGIPDQVYREPVAIVGRTFLLPAQPRACWNFSRTIRPPPRS